MFNLFKRKKSHVEKLLDHFSESHVEKLLDHFSENPVAKWPEVIKSYKEKPDDYSRGLNSLASGSFDHISEHIRWKLAPPLQSDWLSLEEAKELVERFPVFEKTKERMIKDGLDPTGVTQIEAEKKLIDIEAAKPITPSMRKKLTEAGKNPDDYPDRSSAREFISKFECKKYREEQRKEDAGHISKVNAKIDILFQKVSAVFPDLKRKKLKDLDPLEEYLEVVESIARIADLYPQVIKYDPEFSLKRLSDPDRAEDSVDSIEEALGYVSGGYQNFTEDTGYIHPTNDTDYYVEWPTVISPETEKEFVRDLFRAAVKAGETPPPSEMRIIKKHIPDAKFEKI
jgi:hypothetical protein